MQSSQRRTTATESRHEFSFAEGALSVIRGAPAIFRQALTPRSEKEMRRLKFFPRRKSHCHCATVLASLAPMAHAADRKGSSPDERRRMQVLYSGRVQGVGFRYAVRTLAAGFEVTGTVRNLADGRVELTAEGRKTELDAFREAIRDAGLAANIRHEDAIWADPSGDYNGFAIVDRK
jgi:acylphosphatase